MMRGRGSHAHLPQAEAYMSDPQTIRGIFERHVRTLTHKPARGLLTFATTARRVDGLRCEIEEGAWRIAADVPVRLGGSDTARMMFDSASATNP